MTFSIPAIPAVDLIVWGIIAALAVLELRALLRGRGSGPAAEIIPAGGVSGVPVGPDRDARIAAQAADLVLRYDLEALAAAAVLKAREVRAKAAHPAALGRSLAEELLSRDAL
jgi:hypothetical protein